MIKLFWEIASNIRAWIDFKAELSDELYKASDMFLMPSLFEPCGISQMIAMKYGSVPIVRAVGGLDDTVVAYPNKNAVNTVNQTQIIQEKLVNDFVTNWFTISKNKKINESKNDNNENKNGN